MNQLAADARFSARTLARTPWFTALAVITLALGIGTTTAIFSLVDAVFLRPLPFSAPSQLVEIWGQDDKRTGMRVPGAVLAALRAQSQTLQAVGTHHPSAMVMNTPDGALELRGETVSANFVDVFGVAPIFGRGFAPGEDRPGAPAATLVSFGFWRQQLGSDPAAVGRVLFLDGTPHTVIGIMPPTFRTNFQTANLDFWTVDGGNRARELEREIGYEVVARIANHTTIEQARGEIEAIAGGITTPGWRDVGRRIGVVPLEDEIVGNRATALTLLMAAVGLLLAMACANLAQLLLARSDRRLTEFATRKALGAGPAELFRLALTESLLLSIAGGAGGIVLAYWLVPFLLVLAPIEIPRLAEATVDVRVMSVAMLISIVSGCAFGLAPAWRLSRLSVVQAMRHASCGAHDRAPLRSLLVVAQVAVAVTLLAAATLIVQAFVTLQPSSPGFATESRLAFVWGIRESQFPDVTDRRRRVADWLERLEASPGITGAAVASSIPFGDDEPRLVPVRLPHETGAIDESTRRAGLRAVSPRFFALFQMPIRQGRAFTIADAGAAPRVAIVNRTLARTLGSPETVVGQRVRIGGTNADAYEIVGVVDDTRWWGTTIAPLNEVYTPIEQDRASFGFVVIESPLDAIAATSAIKAAFHAALPGAALPASRQAIALQTMIDRSIAAPRFNATLVGAFSGMAIILAVIGLFGLVAYSVSHRRRDLAVRTALGARPALLIAASMRWAMMLAAIGIATGLAAGVALRRVIETQLYAVQGLDLLAYAGAAILMIATAAVAAYYPASRAVHADPMTALRED